MILLYSVFAEKNVKKKKHLYFFVGLSNIPYIKNMCERSVNLLVEYFLLLTLLSAS